MKLLPNANQNEIPGELFRESHAETLKALTDIGSNIKKLMEMETKRKESSTKLITLSAAPLPFSSEGYLYNSIIAGDSHVSDSLKLIVNVDGVTYTTTLAAGENIVNIPNGSTISCTTTSGNGAAVVLTRFNFDKQ